jgi:polysaccharide transporter, PST family
LALKLVAKNAAWLGLVQVLHYVLPLLTVPVVARAFGPNLYGVLATFSAYATYVGILTEFGFQATGARAIASSRSDDHVMSKTVSTNMCAQLLLGGVGIAIFCSLLPFIPNGREYKYVAILVLIQIFSTSMTPRWIFLGLEQTRNFAIIQLVIRVFAAALVLLIIRTANDLTLFVIINCVAAVSILILSCLEIARNRIRWQSPSIKEIVSAIRQSSQLFFSAVSISLYTTTNVLIVAYMLGPAAAGAFALADRIRLATGGVIAPMTQAVYPLVCRISGREATDEEAWAKRVFLCSIIALSACISITLFIFAPLIIWLAGGKAFTAAVPVLRIIAFLPVIIAFSNTFGMQTLLPLGMDREFTWVVSSAALLGVTGLFVLTHDLGLTGAALTMLIVESYVTVALAILVRRRISIASLFFKHT